MFRRAVPPDDPAGFEALGALVRDWEPRLELYRPPRDALLYEPDGVLYAVCLAEELALRAGHRDATARRGDALIIPQALAVDAGPDVDLLALRYDGPPPDHFRERFIQVWGFEHRPVPPADPVVPQPRVVIPAERGCFRVPYAIFDVNEASTSVEHSSTDLTVYVGLDGFPEVSQVVEGVTARACLRRGFLLGVAPGAVCRVRGPGRVGLLTVSSELAHEARRAGGGPTPDAPPSPEYRPPA